MRTILRDLALPTFQRFADRWGYAVRAEELDHDGRGASETAQHAKWTKLALLREALADYPRALWLDADVLVVRFDENIVDHLHSEHFQALALEQVPYEHRVNPNTGVWLLRSCPEAFDFLDAVEAPANSRDRGRTRARSLAALGWRRGDHHYHWAGPGDGSPFLARTSWLPPGWNQPYVDGRDPDGCYNSDPESYATRPTVPDPHVVHFMGMTVEARAVHMARCAATVVP